MKVLVTGAAGFVGRHLLEELRQHEVVPALLNEAERAVAPSGVVVGDIGDLPDWRPYLDGVDAVIHLAARAHILNDTHPDPAGEFERINHEATLHLARQASECGVRRFVFVSTIGVHGDGQAMEYAGPGYRETDPPAPHDAYSESKLGAERGLLSMPGLEAAIIRPPLVYGPGVQGNFRELLKWARRGWPLPLGLVRNRRSLVSVRNLVLALRTLAEHPRAGGEVFIVSDGEEFSTPQLILLLARAMERPAALLPVPVGLLRLGAGLLGRQKMLQRLTGSLVVDSSKLRQTLGWQPPVPTEKGLRETAQWFASL